MFPANQEEVMLFDVDVTLTRMLDGKVNGHPKWFLSLLSVASLDKLLLAGYRTG